MLRNLLLAAALVAGLSSAAQAQTAKTYRSSSPVTPGTPVPYGDGVALSCSAPGTLRLVMQDGTFLDMYALQGTAIVDNLAVKDVNAAGSNATCTVSVLRGF